MSVEKLDHLLFGAIVFLKTFGSIVGSYLPPVQYIKYNQYTTK